VRNWYNATKLLEERHLFEFLKGLADPKINWKNLKMTWEALHGRTRTKNHSKSRNTKIVLRSEIMIFTDQYRKKRQFHSFSKTHQDFWKNTVDVWKK